MKRLNFQRFPSIEELEAVEGAIKMPSGNSQVALPEGVKVSKLSDDPNQQVVIQPPMTDANIKERHRQVVGPDGSVASEFLKTATSTTTRFMPNYSATSSLVELQQQAQMQQQ